MTPEVYTLLAKLEAEARSLRDSIYGPQKEANWERCRDFWMKDIRWLREQLICL